MNQNLANKQIKTTAVADGSFNREKQKETTITAVTTQGKFYIENIETTRVKIDGENATNKIIELNNEKNSVKQSNLFLLQGTTIAGLNVINIPRIYEKTKKPVITVLSKKPSEEKIKKAIKKVENSEEKLKKLNENPKYRKHEEKNIYYSSIGLNNKETERIIEKMIHKGNYPESLRITKKIARSITEANK